MFNLFVNKSYNLYDEPAKFENGELLVDEFGNTYYEQIEVTPANLKFTDYQNYPLEYGVSEGLTTLEDVFFENTRSHILLINEYTEEDLLIKEARNFKSTEDDTGKFTLFNSLNAVNINLEKLKMGIEINSSDLNSLYQFSK